MATIRPDPIDDYCYYANVKMVFENTRQQRGTCIQDKCPDRETYSIRELTRRGGSLDDVYTSSSTCMLSRVQYSHWRCSWQTLNFLGETVHSSNDGRGFEKVSTLEQTATL